MWVDVSWVDGIIFDCDGVLIDSEEANIRFYSLILERMGLSPLSETDKTYVHMHTVGQSLAWIVPGHRLQEAEKTAWSISYRQVLDWVRPQPGLLEFLQMLSSAGLHCAISTNRTGSLPLVLERFHLNPFFFPIVTASDVTWPKPHPESVNAVLQRWNMQRDQVVFIGDSSVDQHTAEAAQVTFWSYANPELEADQHISDYWSLSQSFRNFQSRCLEAPLCW